MVIPTFSYLLSILFWHPRGYSRSSVRTKLGNFHVNSPARKRGKSREKSPHPTYLSRLDCGTRLFSHLVFQELGKMSTKTRRKHEHKTGWGAQGPVKTLGLQREVRNWLSLQFSVIAIVADLKWVLNTDQQSGSASLVHFSPTLWTIMSQLLFLITNRQLLPHPHSELGGLLPTLLRNLKYSEGNFLKLLPLLPTLHFVLTPRGYSRNLFYSRSWYSVMALQGWLVSVPHRNS